MPTTQTKMEVISSILLKKYKAEKKDATYINCVVDQESHWSYEYLFDEKRKLNKKKSFHILEIKPIESEIPSYAMGVNFTKGKLRFAERTGVFRILFSDDSFIYFAKWFAGIGKSRVVESIFCTENNTWIKFLKLVKNITVRKIKPKIGVYGIIDTPHGMVYNKIKTIPNNTIFHNELPKIKESINYYFNNVASFMKYNQPGRRTLLLYGEPGTSKTSTLYQLALEHKETKSVVFSTDINSLAQHIVACEKYSIPTIACFEDCESVFGYNDSGVKSFLSGVTTGRNKNGTCIVLTTNYPERIEASIKERPERIDELHYIGPIDGDLLVQCAKFYFGEFMLDTLDLKKILVKPMTGAEVKLMVDNTLRYCASFQKELNEDSIRKVLSNYRGDIIKLEKFSKGKANKTYTKTAIEAEPMGFMGAKNRVIYEEE